MTDQLHVSPHGGGGVGGHDAGEAGRMARTTVDHRQLPRYLGTVCHTKYRSKGKFSFRDSSLLPPSIYRTSLSSLEDDSRGGECDSDRSRLCDQRIGKVLAIFYYYHYYCSLGEIVGIAEGNQCFCFISFF